MSGSVVEEGRPAPDFTLASDSGEPVTLSSFRGAPVVLYFYPGTTRDLAIAVTGDVTDLRSCQRMGRLGDDPTPPLAEPHCDDSSVTLIPDPGFDSHVQSSMKRIRPSGSCEIVV